MAVENIRVRLYHEIQIHRDAFTELGLKCYNGILVAAKGVGTFLSRLYNFGIHVIQILNGANREMNWTWTSSQIVQVLFGMIIYCILDVIRDALSPTNHRQDERRSHNINCDNSMIEMVLREERRKMEEGFGEKYNEMKTFVNGSITVMILINCVFLIYLNSKRRREGRQVPAECTCIMCHHENGTNTVTPCTGDESIHFLHICRDCALQFHERAQNVEVTNNNRDQGSQRSRPYVWDSESRLCTICWDQEKGSVIFPCRHMCACLECAQQLLDSRRSCPICRSDVVAILEVHGAEDPAYYDGCACGAAPNCFFFPCRHRPNMCKRCAEVLVATNRPCPICARSVSDVAEYFSS